MSKNTFGAAGKLRVGDREYGYFRLARLEETGVGRCRACRFRSGFCSRTCCARRTASASRRRTSSRWRGRRGGREGDQLHAGARAAAGFHRRARAWWIWPPCAMRWPPWAPTPSRANPLLPADLVIDHSVQVDQFGIDGRLRRQRAARIPAQPRALHAAALGPDRVPQFPRGAARYRHRPPGEPGISGAGGVPHQAWRGRIPIRWWARIRTPP